MENMRCQICVLEIKSFLTAHEIYIRHKFMLSKLNYFNSVKKFSYFFN